MWAWCDKEAEIPTRVLHDFGIKYVRRQSNAVIAACRTAVDLRFAVQIEITTNRATAGDDRASAHLLPTTLGNIFQHRPNKYKNTYVFDSSQRHVGPVYIIVRCLRAVCLLINTLSK